MKQSIQLDGEFCLNKETDDSTCAALVKLNKCKRSPPKTTLSPPCHWYITEDKCGIEWRGDDDFDDWVDWLEYIIEKILAPKKYVLNGTLTYWCDECAGTVLVTKNKVRIL